MWCRWRFLRALHPGAVHRHPSRSNTSWPGCAAMLRRLGRVGPAGRRAPHGYRHKLPATLVCFAMRCTRKLLRALGALAMAGLLAGCTAPIGIRIADPREVQRYLTRSALTDERPSGFSQNELRRYDLLEAYDREPDSPLAKPPAAALPGGVP